jgi:hypothetical protein
MSDQKCSGCGKSKAALHCGNCSAVICKYCAVFLEEERVSFFAKVPDLLKHATYCGPCWDRHVAPALIEYDELMNKARQVSVFNKSQGKETRLVKRIEKPVSVSDCKDHDETVMRLAFFAAQLNFNALVDVNLTYKKVKMDGYQTTVWSGTGVPAQFSDSRVVHHL